MKKFLALFTGAVFFMYAAFAVNYYFQYDWFEMPTRILAIVITVIHIVLISLHLYSEAKTQKE